MKHILASVLTLFSLTIFAQQKHFIYIQSDNQQAFYVKLDKMIMSSSATGYIIIPKLKEGAYEFAIGFPKNEWPEQKVTCNVATADIGYLLKNFGEKGWGLFNFQTLDLLMANNNLKTDTSTGKENKEDAFANVLSTVVNDPAITAVNNTPEPPKTTNIPAPVEKKAAGKKTVVTKPAPPTQKSTKKTPSGTKRTNIAKLTKPSVNDTLIMFYVDRVNGKTDTIDVEIPLGNAEIQNKKVTDNQAIASSEETMPNQAINETTNLLNAEKKIEESHIDTVISAGKEIVPATIDSGITKQAEIKADTVADIWAVKPAIKKQDQVKQKSTKRSNKTIKEPRQEIVKAKKQEVVPVIDSTVALRPVIKTADLSTDSAIVKTDAKKIKYSRKKKSNNEITQKTKGSRQDIAKPQTKEIPAAVDSAMAQQSEAKPLVTILDSATVKSDDNKLKHEKKKAATNKTVKRTKAPIKEVVKETVRNNPDQVDSAAAAQPLTKKSEILVDSVMLADIAAARQRAIDSVVALKLEHVADSMHVADSIANDYKRAAMAADSMVKALQRTADSLLEVVQRQKEEDSMRVATQQAAKEVNVNNNVVVKDTVQQQTVALAKANTITPAVEIQKAENNTRANDNSGIRRPAAACKVYADDDEYLSLRKKMDKVHDNENEMLSLANKLFEKRCFSTKQVQRLSLLFSTDMGKYKLFDAAYQHTYDSENFPTLIAEIQDDYYKKRFNAMLR